MPGVVRLGDLSSGHGGFPPKPSIQASGDTFANSKGMVRVGDAWAVHKNKKKSHGSVSSQGSPNVYVNGKPVVRKGDAHSCGDTCNQCSPDVIIN